MSNLALVTDNMLPVANETFIDNLSAGISAGAAIVPINSLAEYADGDSVVLTVDPGTASQATFIGEKQGNTVIDCKWTEGNVGASHAAGATVIDYDSATHYNVVTKLLRMFANENGSLKTSAVQAALNISSAVPADWTPLANVPSVTANNGQREHVLTFTGVNYLDRLQVGTRLRIPRTGSVPTRSAQFISTSSQYAAKATPTGPLTTFTDDFTMECTPMLTSYPSGASWLFARINAAGTAGYGIQVLANGRVKAYALGGGSRILTSLVSLPLNKKTHIAVTMDFSTATFAMYFDGVSVPFDLWGFAIAFVQPVAATEFSIGRYMGGEYLSHINSEVRVWNTLRTPAEIRNNANIQLVGNEAGLVGYWKLDGDWNDSTANANHLTPSGGAINTYTGHPFSAIEYAIVTKIDLVGADTVITVYAGESSIPQAVLAAVSYSNLGRPYGFPNKRSQWTITVPVLQLAVAQGSPTVGIYYNLASARIMLPIGNWKLSYKTVISTAMALGGNTSALSTLSTSPTAESVTSHKYFQQSLANDTAAQDWSHQNDDVEEVTSNQVLYYLIHKTLNVSQTQLIMNSNVAFTKLQAECAYL